MAVDQGAAVWKTALSGGQLGYCLTIYIEIKVDESFRWIDGHAVLWDAFVHSPDKPRRFAPICGDEEEVIDEAEQQTILRI